MTHVNSNFTKVIHFTDFHAHIFEDFAKPDPEFVNDRFRAQLDTLQRVFDLAREHNAAVVFGGDLFHKRSKLEDVVFNNVYKVFAQNNDIATYLVRGNHDSKNNTTNSEHWLEVFKYLDHITVLDKPARVDMWGKCTLYAIPYSDDTNYLKQCIGAFADQQAKEDKPSILAAHIGVDGSEVGKYSHRLEGAFKIGDLYPDVFTYVALGHYHKRQFLGGLHNVFYTGNTIQTSFSDEGQEKGVMLIDLENSSQPEFIPIENKLFMTLTGVDEHTQDLVNNHYVRLVLSKEQAREVEVFKDDEDNFRLEVQREYKLETRIDISVESETAQIVSAYAKEFCPEAEALLLDILKEAEQLSA
jgi:DNA repair exonuclease SbcCD nuclease subunit